VRGDEVTLLELDRDQDVGGRHDREEEMRRRHRRRPPEREEPADVERVPDDLVRAGRPELEVRVRLAAELEPDLAEAEEVEVIDEERAGEHRRPADREDPCTRRPGRPALDLPHDAADRPPLPEEQQERDARREHVRAALGRVGTKRVSHRLKAGRAITLCWTAKSAEQPEVDRERGRERASSGPSIRRGTTKPPTNPTA
jgi:hypothetical protein